VAAFLCQCARQPLGGPAQLYQARAEEAFLAGLLHNIGELFLLKVLERRGNHREQPLGLTQVLVDEVLEAMHADIGYRLMQRWGNPEQYARVARDHHAVELNEGDVLLVITRLLDVACEKLGIDRTPTSCWPHP
jgi:HD-like signal output (HDOD) protein